MANKDNAYQSFGKSSVLPPDTLIAISDTEVVPLKELIDAWRRQRWIPVAERLPDRNGEVFVVCTDNPRPHIVCWNNETPFSSPTNLGLARGFWDNGVYLETEVTHWMLIPERPEN